MDRICHGHRDHFPMSAQKLPEKIRLSRPKVLSKSSNIWVCERMRSMLI